MGHIFISYSHQDSKYAHELAENLQSTGLEVWIDARIDYGSQWPHEIQTQLDLCDAFILVMTPRSFASEWVQSELQRAKRKAKPIFPLLLEGNEPWLSVESTQYYDVRDGSFPDARFYSALKRMVKSSATAQTFVRTPKVAAKKESQAPRAKMKTEVVVAIIGGLVTIVTACATIVFGPVIAKWVNDGSLFPSAPQISATQDPASGASSEATEAPVAAPIDVGIEMVSVPEGEFSMGLDVDASLNECRKYSSECSVDVFKDETPPHQVYLDAFYMDKYEVTNAHYKTCVDAGICQPPANTDSATRDSYYGNSEFDNYPVIYVTWDMAKTFCEWRGTHLPTEAQWEKAARGEHTLYPWGENADTSFANYNNEIGDTTAVGSYENEQSPYGLYDMAGNVWEWTADWYADSYQGSLSIPNPTGPDSGSARVLRGGSWYDPAYLIGTSVRLMEEAHVDNNFGFRCASSSAP